MLPCMHTMQAHLITGGRVSAEITAQTSLSMFRKLPNLLTTYFKPISPQHATMKSCSSVKSRAPFSLTSKFANTVLTT